MDLSGSVPMTVNAFAVEKNYGDGRIEHGEQGESASFDGSCRDLKHGWFGLSTKKMKKI
jgi:hypothetical protein